jgi:hypothetical protein
VRHFARSHLGYALIAAYLLCDGASVAARIAALGPGGGLILFLSVYAVTATALVLTASIPNTALRIALAVIFAAGSVVSQTFEWGMRQPLSYGAFIGLIEARDDTGDAIRQYGGVLALTVPIGLLLLIALALPKKPLPLPGGLTLLAPIAITGGLCAMLFLRGGEGATALPPPFAPIAYSVLGAGSSFATARRGTVEMRRRATRVARDIVLIVDESISPIYLDIADPAAGVHSGLAVPRPGIRIVDYGFAAAIHNCSAGANATLRYGGTRDNYRAMKAAGVTIWDYAKRAGLRTVYLDGQRNHGVLQNMMTPEEKTRIDDFVQLDGVPMLDRDITLARLIAERINNDEAEFILVNKVGGHFPVYDRFPDRMDIYRPTLPRGLYAELTDDAPGTMTDFAGFDGSAQAWQRYRNSYRNTLLWNVGEFFDRLMSEADFSKATVLYTSDHGQDLHENGSAGASTHCGTRPVQEEGIVPLLIIEGSRARGLDWQRDLAANHDRTSAYHIFPTLLALMDYDPADIATHYGAPLNQPTHDAYTFNVDYHVLFGRDPTWRKIDLRRLARAPPADYAPAFAAAHADVRGQQASSPGRSVTR